MLWMYVDPFTMTFCLLAGLWVVAVIFASGRNGRNNDSQAGVAERSSASQHAPRRNKSSAPKQAPYCWTRRRVAVWGFLLAGMLFIPSCLVIKQVLDLGRFGEFRYASAGEISDGRVNRWLPPDAREIVLFRSQMGHLGRFKIGEESLAAWFRVVQARSSAPHSKRAAEEQPCISQEEFLRHFSSLGHICPEGLRPFADLHYSNGAGFNLWYSVPEETAVIDVGYW